MNNLSFNINDFAKFKQLKYKISMLTAYDFFSAKILEEAGIHTILVGDSMGMVIQGKKDTISVTLDDVVYHTKAVRNGAPNTFIVADMPYLTYHTDIKDTVKNAGKLIVDGGANAVKVEINHTDAIKHIEALISAQIPVMGHIGLTPQSINMFGGFKMQGKSQQQRNHILNIAKQLEQSGICCVVLECIPHQLAKEITQLLTIPTIGIGSGASCDGQVLVFHDIFGFNQSPPKFVKKYMDANALIKNAVHQYINDIQINISYLNENPSEVRLCK